MKTVRLLPLLAAVFFGCSPSESNDHAAQKPASETSRALYQCMSPTGFGENATASGSGPNTAIISWNTCGQSYSTATTTKIEVVPLASCGVSSGTGPSTTQFYTLPNIFIPCTGTYSLNVGSVGQKCMNWRLVNSGSTDQGQACKTVSAWHYYNFSP